MSRSRWYVGVLVVRARVEGTDAGLPLLDLQYRLIRATNSEAGYRRALELGAQANHSYVNADGAAVTWQFVGLADLRELDERVLGDGIEVYSQILREDPDCFVVPKEKLSAFWSDANKHKTARKILNPE